MRFRYYLTTKTARFPEFVARADRTRCATVVTGRGMNEDEASQKTARFVADVQQLKLRCHSVAVTREPDGVHVRVCGAGGDVALGQAIRDTVVRIARATLGAPRIVGRRMGADLLLLVSLPKSTPSTPPRKH